MKQLLRKKQNGTENPQWLCYFKYGAEMEIGEVNKKG
jgi:hypothetical protein